MNAPALNRAHEPRPRRRVYILVLGLALVAAGCGSTPVEPTGAVGPTPKTYTPPPGSWTVTMTVTGASGSSCIPLDSLGASATVQYTLQGEGTSAITFVGPDSEWTSFTVTVNGLSFQATSLTFPITSGRCAPYVYSSRFAGTFSADRAAFTATQADTYTLPTGDVISETWTWSGKRN